MSEVEKDFCLKCGVEIVDGGCWGYCDPCGIPVFDKLVAEKPKPAVTNKKPCEMGSAQIRAIKGNDFCEPCAAHINLFNYNLIDRTINDLLTNQTEHDNELN